MENQKYIMENEKLKRKRRKKRKLKKLIKEELAILNESLEDIDKKEKNTILKPLFINRTRKEYFDTYIKPLMLIYQS